MDAEQVTEKILADARAEAEKIAKQTQDKQAAEQAGFTEQMQEYENQTQMLAQKAGKDKKLHLLAAARMDIAKDFLTEKRKILDKVFVHARRQLQDLPDEEYRALMAKLMLQALDTGQEEVIIDKDEKRIDQNLLDQVNEQLGSDKQGNLRLARETQNLGGGGFLLKRGKIKNNVSVNVLLTQTRNELEIDLARELFS